MKTYSIIRHYHPAAKREREVIMTGLTLEEAQEHCKREDTHRTTGPEKLQYFDGYSEE
jgi:hypothetical protein